MPYFSYLQISVFQKHIVIFYDFEWLDFKTKSFSSLAFFRFIDYPCMNLIQTIALLYWLPPEQHPQAEHSLVCVEGRGRISRSDLTQDIKMGSCLFQRDIPHQFIARQVGPESVYCDVVGCHVLCLYIVTGWGVVPWICILWQGVVSCPVCCMTFLCVSILIWSQMFTNDIKPKTKTTLL